MPVIAGLAIYIRHRRNLQMRDWIQTVARGTRSAGLSHDGLSAPDGRTLIELAKLRNADRDKARAMFERLITQKLDVLKTGVAMGYKQEDLSALDERLEKIIGSEKLASLMGDELPSADLSSGALQTSAAVEPSVKQT